MTDWRALLADILAATDAEMVEMGHVTRPISYHLHNPAWTEATITKRCRLCAAWRRARKALVKKEA